MIIIINKATPFKFFILLSCVLLLSNTAFSQSPSFGQLKVTVKLTKVYSDAWDDYNTHNRHSWYYTFKEIGPTNYLVENCINKKNNSRDYSYTLNNTEALLYNEILTTGNLPQWLVDIQPN